MLRNTKREEILKSTFDYKVYFFVCIIFLIGIICGAIYFRIVLNDTPQAVLSDNFQTIQETAELTKSELLSKLLLKNVKTLITYWIIGISVVGAPFLALNTLAKGFSTSFAVSTVVYNIGFLSGNKLIFRHMFLHSAFAVLAIIVLTVSSVKVTFNVLRNKKDIKVEIIRHSITAIVALVLFAISILVEVFFRG